MTRTILHSALFVFLIIAADSPGFTAGLNYAPTIDDTPGVVIGDADGVSATNVFVFPDAINLDAIGHDDTTSASGLIWSYSSPSGVYRINGAEPVNPAVDDLVNPTAAKRINTQKDPLDTTRPRTITFRDNLRSPLDEAGGIGPYSDRYGSTSSGPATYIDSRVVTLYCSDGTTVSLANARSIIIYTLDNGYDVLSGCIHSWPPDPRPPTGWSFVNYNGTVNPQITSTALCIAVGATGDNDGVWRSPYALVTLEPDSAWELRLVVTTTQTSPYHTPLWTVVYENNGGTGVGHDEYGGEFFFLDNEGGANSPIGTVGRNSYSCWLMPIAMQAPQFANSAEGYFNPRVDADNDMRVSLRVLDIGTSYGAQYDSGTICWNNMTIFKHSLSDMVVDSNTYAVAQFADPKVSPSSPYAWQLEVSGQGAVPVYHNGAVSIVPATNWSTGTVIMFRPGDLNAKIEFPFPDPGIYMDNWPIAWVADKLYYIEFMLSSPSAWDEVNPPDMIRIGADTLTSELCCVNFAVPNTPDLSQGALTNLIYRGVSMPRAGVPQKYGCFFSSHSVSKTAIPEGARWRPRLEILTNSTLQPMGRATSLGGITVNSMTVKAVHFAE